MRYGWILDGRAWGKLRDAMCQYFGKSPEAQLLRLSIHSGKLIQADSGVYMLCAPTPKCNLRVKTPGNDTKVLYDALYVGQTTNLKERYRDYAAGRGIRQEKIKQLLREVKDIDFCYWVIPGAKEATLKKIEGIMIDCIGPVANSKRGDGTVRAKIGAALPA